MSNPLAKDAKIWTDLGPVTVRPYLMNGKSKPDSQKMEKGAKTYAYAIYSRALDKRERFDLESAAGLKFLGVHDISNGNVIYRTAAHRSLENTRQILKKRSPAFINLEPIYPEDKVSRKIYTQSGFAAGERDNTTGTIYARVEFFEDVPWPKRDSIIENHIGRKSAKSSGGSFLLNATPALISNLSLRPEIRSIREENTEIRPTNDVSRALTGVDAIQTIDYASFPPDTTWMAADSLTGDSVVIGIEDTGIDSLHNDFLEEIPCAVPPCPTRLRKSPSFPFWSYPSKPCPSPSSSCNHGTHVAAIAAGNGWMSESAGGTRYQWRGVAPKAVLATHGELGDVNNHSHTDGDGSYLNRWDEATWQHGRVSPAQNIVVFAAANQGVIKQWSPQVGYYSLLANAKNVITVGNVQKEDTVRSIHSSMGPTRDGRIKPDIVAPGSSMRSYPSRNNRFPSTVEVDYIRILDSTGAVKLGWEFNSGTEGWGVNRLMAGGWGGLERYNISAPVHVDSVLRFQSTSAASYLWSDSIATVVQMGSRDSLDIRLRIIHPAPGDYDFPFMQGRLYWKRLDSAVYASGSNELTYRFSSPDFFRIKQPLQGWSPTDTLMALRLDFLGDTLEYGIVSAETLSTVGASRSYYRAEGTSMAAPHVSGIVALMLDKYNRKYLKPRGRNIHDHAFWNSTAKAILIHSAIDLAYEGNPREPENADIFNHDPSHGASVKYHAGPDFATGYGLVNTPDAIHFVDTSMFKEDSLDNAQELFYGFNVSQNVNNLRVTLAWDDPPGNASAPLESPKLINNLDLVVEDPLGNIHRPWVLRAPPQNLPLSPWSGQTALPPDGLDPIDSVDIRPAEKGTNSLDNVEVVDVGSSGFLPQGRWKIRVKGTRVAFGPQDLSLVSDFPIRRDSMTAISTSLVFRADIGSTISTATALRTSDSTVYFGAGTNGEVLHAYSLGQQSVRWTFSPHSMARMTDPIVAGNRIFLAAGDSLYCIRDDGNHATLVWGRRLFPSDDSTTVIGDTGTYYFWADPFAPAVDIANNRLYLAHTFFRERRMPRPGTPPWDSTIDNTTNHKLSTFDLNGNLIGSADALESNASQASAGTSGGFFLDVAGRLYRVNRQGSLLDSSRYLPTGSRISRQPVIGPNGVIYVQNDSIIIAIDQQSGDSLACFNSQIRILSNIVIDGNDNVHLVGYQSQPSPTTRYLVYSSTGGLLLDASLGNGMRSVGELAVGSDNLVYFIQDSELHELNYYSAPPLEDSRKFPVIASPGRSPAIGTRYAVFASGRVLSAYAITSDGLSNGWGRSGRDNSNSSFQNLETPGFSPQPVGTESAITTASWNDARCVYTLCGSSSGLGGAQDDFGFSHTVESGNFEYVARIKLLDASHPSAKAGLIVRTNLSDNAPNGFVWVSASNTGGFSKRNTSGGSTSSSGALGSFMPGNAWVKVRRIGQTLHGFISPNGLHYTKVGSMSIGTGTVYVGLAQTSGTSTSVGCAEYSNISSGIANPEALFVVGDTSLSGIDAAIRSRLLGLGYQVTVKSGVSAQASDADFKDLVVISSTVTSTDVSTKFRTIEVPVLTWEPNLSDELGMTGNVAGTDQGTQSGQSQIQIVDPGHALAAGKSGNVTVYVSSSTVTWGKPNANAFKVATVVGDANKSVIYAYEQGAGMVGLRAPARRVGMFLENASGLQLNANGQALFDTAVKWVVAPISPKALFVVGSTSLSAADQYIQNNLTGKGFAITLKSGTASQTADANGKNLVVISSTVNSGDVGTKFTGVDVPVLNGESALLDDLGMTGTTYGTHSGTTNSQTQAKILLADHPGSARLSGNVLVTNTLQTFNWGKPNSNSVSIAALVSDTSKKSAFGYERGTAMISGTAPARRYGIFLHDATATALSDTGLAILDAAVAWSTGGIPVSASVSNVFGMETLQQWTTSDANLTLSSTRTQGSNSIRIEGGGYMLLTSTAMKTQDISGETSNLKIDVFIPGHQPNPYWVGAVQMYAECPSANAYNVYLGQVELTGLPQNQFSTLTFTVPSNVLSILTGNYADFVFKVALNVNQGTEPSLIDNIRFSP